MTTRFKRNNSIKQIKAHFLHAAKMKEVITLPVTTQGVQENKNRSYRMNETSNTTNNKDL
jgi:hypothetical protein